MLLRGLASPSPSLPAHFLLLNDQSDALATFREMLETNANLKRKRLALHRLLFTLLAHPLGAPPPRTLHGDVDDEPDDGRDATEPELQKAHAPLQLYIICMLLTKTGQFMQPYLATSHLAGATWSCRLIAFAEVLEEATRLGLNVRDTVHRIKLWVKTDDDHVYDWLRNVQRIATGIALTQTLLPDITWGWNLKSYDKLSYKGTYAQHASLHWA